MTNGTVEGTYCVGVVTVAASGVEIVSPLLADNLYRNVSITVTPLDSYSNYRYEAQLFLDGESAETHNYTTLGVRNTAHMDYYFKLFPPNRGVSTNPKIFNLGGLNEGSWDIGLVGFTLSLTNNEAERRDFLVYSTFEQFYYPKIIPLFR